MKKFFSSVTLSRSSSVKKVVPITQLEINKRIMEQRAKEAIESINALPPEKRPKNVSREDLKKTLDEADLSRLHSVY